MTATATVARPPRTTTTTAARRIVRFIAYALRAMLAGYWLLMVLGFALVGVGMHLVNGTIHESVWDYASQSPKYFSSAIGMVLMPSFFALMVAHGVTRRSFALAGSILLVLTATATTVLWVVVYQLEHVIFAWRDWPQELMNAHLFTKTSQAGLIFLEFFLLILTHQVAGWLIGTGFFRWGFWTGLALIPLGLVPVVAAELLLVAGWAGRVLLDAGWDRPSLLVSVPAVLLVSAAGLYLNYRLMRPIGLKQIK
ncbi:hypothetical protein [Kribbella deserti]|uniref:ABC transporter permease n=1 Tax=Kribbella deserti TaxID=1926257 RepID=A0ABV6QTL5_9ACTN